MSLIVAENIRKEYRVPVLHAGINLYHQISKLLGYKDIKMTQRNAHYCPDSLRNGVEILTGLSQIYHISQSNEKRLAV